MELELNNTNLENKSSTIEALAETITLIVKFLGTRRAPIKSRDLWTLIKAYYPDTPVVMYWKLRQKENHGIPIEVSEALAEDARIIKISRGRKEVYYKLNDGKNL